MKMIDRKLRFFLGANTPKGFISKFSELDRLMQKSDKAKLYILKGGPGTGKSSLIKKFADEAEKKYSNMEYIHCSSDFTSLDGVIINDINTAIADGTPPHVIEPKYPGCFENIINLGDCWDTSTLQKNSEEIVLLSKENSKYHEHCCRFLSAAAILANDNYKIANDAVDHEKLAHFINRLLKKYIKQQKNNSTSNEEIRLLSAVTNQGVKIFIESATLLAENIFIIEDNYGVVAKTILEAIKKALIDNGYDFITSYCPLSCFEKPEHIFIPSLNLGFMTSNRFHPIVLENSKIINSDRFTFAQILKLKKQRLQFNNSTQSLMIDQAAKMLTCAKTVHDKLEKCYIVAMNFSCLDEKTNSLLEYIL